MLPFRTGHVKPLMCFPLKESRSTKPTTDEFSSQLFQIALLILWHRGIDFLGPGQNTAAQILESFMVL